MQSQMLEFNRAACNVVDTMYVSSKDRRNVHLNADEAWLNTANRHSIGIASRDEGQPPYYPHHWSRQA